MKRTRGLIFAICGPAGVGKNSLGERLLAKFENQLVKSVSVTTRIPRETEVNGRDYEFVSRAEFEKRKLDHRFFECEEVHGNLYGTPKEIFQVRLEAGLDLMTIIDIRGSLAIKKAFPKDTVVVFVVAPSMEDLATRMKARSRVSEVELSKRIATASAELEVLKNDITHESLIDYMVVNQDFELCLKDLERIYLTECLRPSRCKIPTLK